jgi:threonine aldolase
MTEPVDRFEFASDNTAAISPDAWAALVEANNDGVPSYGEDHWTNRVCDRVREIFETDCDVYVIFNGTAANSLALAQLCRSFNSVICHENAHIHTDECGGPEFFSGGAKLLTTPGTNGKLELAEVEAAIARQPELHAPKPRVISVTPTAHGYETRSMQMTALASSPTGSAKPRSSNRHSRAKRARCFCA